jgi:hypothetical protein
VIERGILGSVAAAFTYLAEMNMTPVHAIYLVAIFVATATWLWLLAECLQWCLSLR